MDIHKPKPWHGFRGFLKEYLVIVVGVLTALGGEQLVEEIHWRHEVRAAHGAMAAEIAEDNRVFAYRAAAAPCIERRLDSIEALAERIARREPVPRLGEVMPDTGAALRDNVWESHRASQTLTHFDDEELARLSTYYQQLAYSRQGMTQESDSQAALRILQGDPWRLDQNDISAIRIALQRHRSVNTVLAMIARQQLETSKRLHVAVPPADASRLAVVCQPIATGGP
ncbi:MAG: hypothetical protein JWO33_59 [Caulobacteraceae bacterium]|nr:hypothetical protein [Caulobacteraceae bacterium]